MWNICCPECDKEGVTDEFSEEDFDKVDDDHHAIVHCPYCNAEIDLCYNEFFYELNIDDEEYERMMANGGI